MVLKIYLGLRRSIKVVETVYYTDSDGVTYCKVKKDIAKKCYEDGGDVYVCGNNLIPFDDMWNSEILLNKEDEDGKDFETVYNAAFYENTGNGMGSNLNCFISIDNFDKYSI